LGMNFLPPFVCFLVMKASYKMKPMWLVCNVILIPSFFSSIIIACNVSHSLVSFRLQMGFTGTGTVNMALTSPSGSIGNKICYGDILNFSSFCTLPSTFNCH
jgi:hypothetical protein